MAMTFESVILPLGLESSNLNYRKKPMHKGVLVMAVMIGTPKTPSLRMNI